MKYSILLLTGTAVALGLGPVDAATFEEEYQRALMAEKGKGDFTEAIRLYEKLVKRHESTGEHAALAARAQIRLGLCQEKLGLKKAREAFQQVPDKFSDQPQAIMEAAEHIEHVRQAEVNIDLFEQPPAKPVLIAPLPPTPPAKYFGRPGWQQQLERFSKNVDQFSHEITSQVMNAVQSLKQHHSKGFNYTSYAYTQPVIPYEHQRVAQVPAGWKFLLDLEDFDPPGLAKGSEYSRPDYDDSHWAEIQIGQAWEDQGYDRYDQAAWYRVSFDINTKDAKAPVYMAFGGVDLHAYVYINGQLVGEHHHWDQPFILDISDAVKRNDENTVAIYVYDGVGMGGIYGTIDVHQPLGNADLKGFIANHGGRIQDHQHSNNTAVRTYPGSNWTNGRTTHSNGGSASYTQPQYASYAGALPHVPYPHRIVAEIPEKWKFNLDFGTSTANQYMRYTQADYDDSHWPDILIGQAWEDQGYSGYDAAAWYRATVKLDAEAGNPVYMAFGGVDKDARIYVNGQPVGEHRFWNRPFIVDISDAAVYGGENLIAIHVYDGAGMGGIYGLINIHQPTNPTLLKTR